MFFIDRNGDMNAQSTCSRLGECEVCGNTAKYTCPCCELKTCCIVCINIHKKEFECDGKRQKVKFVRRDAFQDKDIENDFRLLEEISRDIEAFKRDPSSHFLHHRSYGLPPHLIKLQTEATKRGVLLKFLPQHFSRHKLNTTYLDWKTNTLSWHIDWIFPQADNLTLSDARVLDSTRLSSALSKHLKISHAPHTSSAMQFYYSAGLSGVKLLLKAEREPGNRFFELEPSQTLKENLEGKAIIEYPVMYVILKDHKDEYDVISLDEEDEIQNKNKHARSRKRILSRENHMRNRKEPKCDSLNKNLLISNENESDNDDGDNGER